MRYEATDTVVVQWDGVLERAIAGVEREAESQRIHIRSRAASSPSQKGPSNRFKANSLTVPPIFYVKVLNRRNVHEATIFDSAALCRNP